MLNLSKFASNVLSSIDNAAKESREEPKQLSAAQIRSERRQKTQQTTNDEEAEQLSLKVPFCFQVYLGKPSLTDCNICRLVTRVIQILQELLQSRHKALSIYVSRIWLSR